MYQRHATIFGTLIVGFAILVLLGAVLFLVSSVRAGGDSRPSIIRHVSP